MGNERAMENSPLWLCKFIVQRPKLSFGESHLVTIVSYVLKLILTFRKTRFKAGFSPTLTLKQVTNVRF